MFGVRVAPATDQLSQELSPLPLLWLHSDVTDVAFAAAEHVRALHPGCLRVSARPESRAASTANHLWSADRTSVLRHIASGAFDLIVWDGAIAPCFASTLEVAFGRAAICGDDRRALWLSEPRTLVLAELGRLCQKGHQRDFALQPTTT